MTTSTSVRWSPTVTRWLERGTIAATAAAVVVACMLALMSGCVSTERALKHAKENAVSSAKAAKKPGVSADAKLIARVNRTSWQVQAFLLGGDMPDQDIIDALPLEFRQEIGLASE